MSEQSSRLQDAVNTALAQKQSVRIIGDGSKSFLYSGDTTAPLLNVSDHKGVIEYHPEELVITVRAGTRLSELKDIVANQGQMWACDPPEFDGLWHRRWCYSEWTLRTGPALVRLFA